MNHYTYEEIEIGMKETFSVEVKMEDQEAFCRITGDENPLHRDDAFAREKGYREKVVSICREREASSIAVRRSS